jgi:hypothetical protein
MRSIKILCCAVALAAFTVPNAHADEWNKKTFLTFSGPVQLPGTTLAPGTYVFRLADLSTNRHVVQVLDKDGGKLLATLLTIPNQRLDAPDKNIVMFSERPSGTPQAIKAWWYPGDTIGDEFVYPKSQAMQIANVTHEPVLAREDETGGTTNDAMKGAKVGRVDENGRMTDENPGSEAAAAHSATPAAQANRPAGSSTATAETGAAASTGATGTTAGANARRSARAQSTATGTTGQADASAKRARTQLPRTASSLPLFELLSGLGFAGFFVTRQLRKRLGDHA